MMTFETELLALRPVLKAFATRLCGNPHMADDLVQETCARAWEHQDSFESGTKMQAWLFTIMRNWYYTKKRKYRREIPDPDGLMAASVAAEEMDPLFRLEAEETYEAIKRLSPDQQEILLLAAQDCSYEQMAKALNVPDGTVKSRLNRARRKLAKATGDAQES